MTDYDKLDQSTQIAINNILGIEYLPITGFARAISSGTGIATLWNGPTDRYVFPSSATAASIVSTSANDTAVGTGAQELIIKGLDSNGDSLTETIEINGLTPVLTTGLFKRINSVNVVRAGASSFNEGQIDVTVDGVVASVVMPTDAASLQLVYSVPNDRIYVVTEVRLTPEDGEFYEFQLRVNLNGVDTLRGVYLSGSNASSAFEVIPNAGLRAGTDFEVAVKQQSGADKEVVGTFGGMLVTV